MATTRMSLSARAKQARRSVYAIASLRTPRCCVGTGELCCGSADYQPYLRRIFARQISPELLGWHDQSKIIARYFSVFSITTGKMSSLREISFNNRETLSQRTTSLTPKDSNHSQRAENSVLLASSDHGCKRRLRICKLADRLLMTIPRYHFHKHAEQA